MKAVLIDKVRSSQFLMSKNLIHKFGILVVSYHLVINCWVIYIEDDDHLIKVSVLFKKYGGIGLVFYPETLNNLFNYLTL